jgi:Cytochrome P460
MEVHVKDIRLEGGWGFFKFHGPGNAKLVKRPADCYACHESDAAVDADLGRLGNAVPWGYCQKIQYKSSRIVKCPLRKLGFQNLTKVPFRSKFVFANETREKLTSASIQPPASKAQFADN